MHIPLDIWGSESSLVGLVWSGGDRVLSFPCLVSFFLAVFCVKNLGCDERSMCFISPVLLDIWGPESGPVGLVWSGADRFSSFPYLSFLIFADSPQIQTRQTESGKHLDFIGGGPFF